MDDPEARRPTVIIHHTGGVFMFAFLSFFLLLPPWGETIVVTPSLQKETLQETLAPVEVLDKETLQKRQPTSAFQLFQEIPGVIPSQNGSPGKIASLFIRGGESNQHLVLFEGIPINFPYFGGWDFSLMEPTSWEKIEVVRGPFSALYGPDAMGGVIQFFAPQKEHHQVSLSSGERGYGVAQYAFLKGPWFFNGSYHRDEGFFPHDGFQRSQVITGFHGKGWGILSWGSQSKVDIPFADGGLPSPQREMTQEAWAIAIPIKFSLGRHWLMESSGGYMDYTLSFRDPQDPWGLIASDTRGNRTFGKIILKRTTGPFHIAFGVESRRDEVTDKGTFGVNIEDQSVHEEGLFGELRYQKGAFSLQLGFRGDHHSTFGNTTHPRIALGWKWGNHRLTLAYGTAFRAPSLGELYYPYAGNPELEPEKSRQWDLGWRYHEGNFFLETHLFHSHYTNLIEFNNATFTFFNSGERDMNGMELAGQWSFSGYTVHLATTYLDIDPELLRRPAFQGSLMVEFPLRARVFLGILGFYKGSRQDFDPQTYMERANPSYFRWDLLLRFPLASGFTPWIKLENVFDKAYQDVLGYPSPGRRLVGGIILPIGKPSQ